MKATEISITLWAALALFVLSAAAISRLHRRLLPSRGTSLVVRLLQACCGIGAVLCAAGLILGVLR